MASTHSDIDKSEKITKKERKKKKKKKKRKALMILDAKLQTHTTFY